MFFSSIFLKKEAIAVKANRNQGCTYRFFFLSIKL